MATIGKRVGGALRGEEGWMDNGAIGASFGEPVPGFDSQSERDNRIKEWGIAVGLAYAIVSLKEPFASRDSLEALAKEVAEEAFFDCRPECEPKKTGA